MLEDLLKTLPNFPNGFYQRWFDESSSNEILSPWICLQIKVANVDPASGRSGSR